MKTRTILLMLISMLLTVGTADAQVTKYLKKKSKKATKTAAKTADKEVDKEIDKRVTKGVLNLKNKLINSLEGEKQDSLQQNKATENAGEADPEMEELRRANEEANQKLGGAFLQAMTGGGQATYEDAYPFNGKLTMHMQIYNDGEAPTDSYYTTWFNDETSDVGIDIVPGENNPNQTSALMVFDYKNKTMLILNDDGETKTGIANSLAGVEELADEISETGGEEEYEMPEYNKTGKTKKILSYTCEEYRYTDTEGNTVVMWITDDIDHQFRKSAMHQAGIPVYAASMPYGKGMMMEMETYEGDKLLMKNTVTEIDFKTSHTISTSGYTIIGMGAK